MVPTERFVLKENRNEYCEYQKCDDFLYDFELNERKRPSV